MDFFWGELELIVQGIGIVMFWVFVADFLRVLALRGTVLVVPFVGNWGNMPGIVKFGGNGVVSMTLVVVLLGLLLLAFDLAEL